MFTKKIKRETRELAVRSSLLDKLKQVVQSLLQPSNTIPKPLPSVVLGHADNTNVLCNVLEAVFIHGLRDSLGERMSTLFADPDRMPVPNFWPIILIISHRDLLEQVEQLTFINNEVGKSRAWIRLAVNQSQISSYISVLSGDPRTLKEYYRTSALLRDSECCDIIIRVLQPISAMALNLATNAAVLNTWTQTPLILAGVWTPTSALQGAQIDPVMVATDVASTVVDRTMTGGIVVPESETPISDEMFYMIIGGTPDTSFIGDQVEADEPVKEKQQPKHSSKAESATDIQTGNLSEQVLEIPASDANAKNSEISNIIEGNDELEKSDKYKRYTGSSVTDNDSLTRSVSLIQDAPAYTELFSAFESAQEGEQVVPSLLLPPPPSQSEGNTEVPEPDEEESFSSMDEAVNLNFEVLPKQFMQGEETRRLLPLLVEITTEAGLDAQEYQCHGCKAHIGMLYGKPRVCSYDSKYYCNECHEGELSLIPARMVHNWDLSTHPVSTTNRRWLASIYHQPLLDLRSANPRLYCHVDDLAEMQSLRRQLLYLRAYLMTCRSGVEQDLRKKLWPREYLYEHVHLYSVFDLQLISTGQLIPQVRQAVVWGRNHVLNCIFCGPRGFICEMCTSDEVIYPFQIGNTHTCHSCFAVYHFNCARTRSCPRCKRIQERKAMNAETTGYKTDIWKDDL